MTDTHDSVWHSQRSIALVGMMGVGKTTVGRRLAPRLGLPFVDADEEIERAAGMTVSDLFETHGEESFRRGEQQVIDRLLSGTPIVLATGGGAMAQARTRDIIKQRAISIWLRADLQTVLRRATKRPTRPLLAKGDPLKTLEKLSVERAPFYGEADIVIDCQAGPHTITVDAVVDALKQHSQMGAAPQ